MGAIKEKPVIVNIGTGTPTDSTITLTKDTINVDLFNGSQSAYNQYVLKFDPASQKYIIGQFTPFANGVNLNDCMEYSTMYLNGPVAQKLLGYDLIVGTHIGETLLSDGLGKEQTIKMDGYDVKTKFDFVYVRMSTGVHDDFGDEKYRKSSENLDTASNLKKSATKNNLRVGFYHYLTGYPINNKTSEEIGKDQARKFLEKILKYDANTDQIGDPEALNGGMIPMVVFADNITEANYYGAAPVGVKKELDNF